MNLILWGQYNTYTGAFNTPLNKLGSNNSNYGKHACASQLTGSNNCIYGTHASYNATSMNSNVIMGEEATFNSTGYNNNVDIGYQVAYLDQSSNNVIIGFRGAFNAVSSGFASNLGENVFMGYQVVPSFTYGANNVVLGALADAPSTVAAPIFNAAAIGSRAIVRYTNDFILGNNTQFVGIGLSNDVIGPQADLEIATEHNPGVPAPPGNGYLGFGIFSTPNPYSGTGFTGLKFRDLTSHSTPVNASSFNVNTNPFPTGVLSVDGYGNVIYVPATGLGNCTSPSIFPSGAGSDPAIDLATNTHNFWFEGNGLGTAVTNVIIGNSCGYTPKAKLDVLQKSGSTNGSTGIYVENDNLSFPIPGNNFAIGLESNMPTQAITSSLPNIAGWFEADDCTTSTPSYAIVVPNQSYPAGVTCGGVVSIGFNVSPSTPLAGMPGGGNLYSLQVATPILANGFVFPSDRRYKENFSPIRNAIGKIDSLHPTYFYYDTLNYPLLRFSNRSQVGFIAQNVDSVLPQVVTKNGNGYYDLDYARMTALLVAGIQQQQGIINRDSSRIDSLVRMMNSLQDCIKKLCDNDDHRHKSHKLDKDTNSGGSVIASDEAISVTLSNFALLYQNTPNPFGQSGTVIRYFLPQNTMGASIVFYDMYGNQLQVVQLSQSGMGAINITPDKLSSGVYSYSLVIGGNVIDTKKMLFQK